MFKHLIIVLFCLFAIAHSKYVVQRLYNQQDMNCEIPALFGSFFEDSKCYSMGTTIQRNSCNSTHVKVELECNLECTRCGRSISYPRDKCIPGFINAQFSCPKVLPEIKKKGIYLRSFTNSRCIGYPKGDHGTFLFDEFCNSVGSQNRLFQQFSSSSGKSQKGYFDKKENAYKIEDFDGTDCQGKPSKIAKFPVDRCLKIPDPSFKRFQTPTHAIFSKK